jgi:chromosome segregation ATPase
MARKIIANILIGLSSIFIVLSIVGIFLAWIYNDPLTRESIGRLEEVDTQLSQIQGDLKTATAEVERALRIIGSAEKALESLTQQSTDAKQLLEQLNDTLDGDLIPGLETTRENINGVRSTVEDLRSALEQINTLPFLNLNLPGDELLAGILTDIDSLDKEIGDVQDLAQRASTFISDNSYLLGGDFNNTKQHLEELLKILNDNEEKVTEWRAQVKSLIESIPGWVDRASVILTIFLLWFGFSQLGLFLHGVAIRAGENPLDLLRKP